MTELLKNFDFVAGTKQAMQSLHDQTDKALSRN
jgi:hypothetical protein